MRRHDDRAAISIRRFTRFAFHARSNLRVGTEGVNHRSITFR
jgi:hypothetical protein